MTVAIDKQKVIDIALAEVGYLEKASNSQLDDPTANAGSNNWTKYARDLDKIPGFYNGRKNGFEWCDMFVDWCFVQAYGVDTAKKLLNQPFNSAGAGCTYSAQYFKNAGQFHTSKPQPGDQIFYGNAANAYHTGLVYEVDASYVYTVEGNTSGASGVIANGGGVCRKQYRLNASQIYGYGRPAYGNSITATVKPQASTDSITGLIDTVKEVQIWLNRNYSAGLTLDGLYGDITKKALTKALQKALGVEADGIYGVKTNAAVKLVRYGSKGQLVSVLQAFLVCHGYKEAYVDGDFGNGTKNALTDYQRKYKLEVDGIAGQETFKSLCA